jgi:hypothetical protein
MAPAELACPLGELAMLRRFLTPVVLVLACLSLTQPAASGMTPEDRVALIGQPVALSVLPREVQFSDPDALQQLVVTGHYADGSVRDLTTVAEFGLEDGAIAAITSGGMLAPRMDGVTALLVKAGNQSAKVTVTVKGYANPRPVSFRHELIAALNVGGCNAGACHGTPSGKNGFKLSLRGYDPDQDHIQLTRDVLGRRTAALNPGESLIVQKALARVPHEGGQRFAAGSLPHRILARWIAEGLHDDAKALSPVARVEVLPGDRVQVYPAQGQQLAVIAHYADGSKRDVTLLSNYSSSDPAVADVNRSGLVEFRQAGEAAILVRHLESMVTVRLLYLKPKQNFAWTNPPEHNYIDKLIFAKQKLLNILPAELCTDQEFLRRVYLDLCGILPTPGEAKAFLVSTDPNRRAMLIDELLARAEFADFWTLKWSDVLRANRKTLQLQGVHKFHEWIRKNIAENRPFDQWVRELVTADGSTYANPPANFYRVARDPTSLAETTAQLFFGVRMQCAKCHNHPFERWTQDDYYSLAAFFARVKQKKDPDEDAGKQPAQGAELVYLDRAGEVTQPRTGKAMPPRFPGDLNVPPIEAGQDRREVLARWLTRSDNPFLPKSVVNRVWFHLLGRGIVDPVDDFRDSNPASNEELLAALAKDFVDHGWDQKQLIRTIMNSRTYQLSAQPNEFNKDDNKYFSRAVTRLHTAEQLLDAICSAAAVPEKFPGLPLGTRATQLPDGEVNHVFLKTFGQPARELACECERESDSNLAQALQLINGPTIHEKLRNPSNRIGQLLNAKKSEKEIVDELYLATLSRLPGGAEYKAVFDHVQKAQEKRKAWEDVQWALINSKEFLFRH